MNNKCDGLKNANDSINYHQWFVIVAVALAAVDNQVVCMEVVVNHRVEDMMNGH